jgi:hypothetical protein
MTNEELQQKTLERIKALELTPRQYSRLPKHDKRNIFPIGTTYVYNLARGKFDQCGKHGLLIMKDYFLKLDLNKKLDESFEQYDQVYKNLKTNKDGK